MNRYAFLAGAATVAGCTALSLAVPGGIRTADGCSGASYTWTAPGWNSASWAVDPSGVPTDGAVRLALGAKYSSGSYGGGAAGGAGTVTIAVRGPDDALVAGSPDTQEAPQSATTPPVNTFDGSIIVTWRPAAPFLPSATYTLHVDGLLGNPVDLPFASGAGAFQPPKPVMANPSLSVSRSHFSSTVICCELPSDIYFCPATQKCAAQMIQPAPSISADIDVDETVAAAKTFLKAELQVSVNGAPFITAQSSTVDLVGADGTICARVLATNTLTNATALSSAWCASTDTLDLTASPNCAEMSAVLGACGVVTANGSAGSAGAPSGSKLSADALKVYEQVCGNAGSGGAAGMDGGADSGGSGGSDAATADGRSTPDTQESKGCTVAARSSSGRGSAVVALLFALIATLRFRISKSKRDCSAPN